MVELVIKNVKELEDEYRSSVVSICEEKAEFFKELLKKYDKDLKLEVIFDHSSSLYKVSGSINLKSKKVLAVAEDKDAVKSVTGMFSDLKKMVKKQYELERKDYEYKRKR